MQKLLNDPAQAVLESMRGFALAHADRLLLHESPTFLARKQPAAPGKVTIIAGSGSGHEPLNAGYVGAGMLDACCPGDIFTSPTPDQYLAAVKATYGGAGVILVVKNYMGGVLNTDVVCELLGEEGIPVGTVLVSDDVAVPERHRRRGMGAAVIAEKIVGAAAERRYDLERILSVGRRVNQSSGSMGVALSGCTSPMVGFPTFSLPKGEMELGVGIHGEPGRKRVPITTSDAIVDMLLSPILADLDLRHGERVLAMVSGLGGTPQQELYIFYHHLHRALSNHGITVERSLVGEYVTSLDMAGAAITLTRLDDELLDLWDAPVDTVTLRW